MNPDNAILSNRDIIIILVIIAVFVVIGVIKSMRWYVHGAGYMCPVCLWKAKRHAVREKIGRLYIVRCRPVDGLPCEVCEHEWSDKKSIDAQILRDRSRKDVN
jgi:hypothetical protein